MNITWDIKYLPQQQNCATYCAFSDIKRMKGNIEQSGSVNVSVARRTKTTLDINIWYDKDLFSVAHIPAGAERFKFVESYFSGVFSSGMKYYFRISKKQALPELKEYIGLVLDGLHLNIDALTVNMSIFGVEELQTA